VTDEAKRPLSLKSLRILHRYLDDLAVTLKVKSGGITAVELERLLRHSGAETDEIQYVLADFRRCRSS
jgi:hypothetical protein